MEKIASTRRSEPCFQSKLPHAYPHLSHLGQSLLCFMHKSLLPIHLSSQKGEVKLTPSRTDNQITLNNPKVQKQYSVQYQMFVYNLKCLLIISGQLNSLPQFVWHMSSFYSFHIKIEDSCSRPTQPYKNTTHDVH